MKKDKEWLKEEIKKVSNNYPTYHDERDDLIKKMVNMHEILELIDQLDEPDLTVEYRKGYEQGILNATQTANESKLVEIPQFVADFIKGRTVSECFYYSYIMPNECNQETYEWINDNQTETARAILDGYTIGKSKRYRVQLPDAESNASSNLLGLMKTGDSRIVICKIKFNTFLYSDNVRLTEQEIKRNHEYLWAFAEEVPNE